MKTTSVIALALSVTPALAVPPANFGFPTSEGDTPLSVTFQSNGSSLRLQPGQLFGIDVPVQAPAIAVNTSYTTLNNNYSGQYMLMMVDPDASYPENPSNRFIVHWWQMNLTRSTQASDTSDSIGGTRLINGTAPRVPYRRPAPPTNSSAHRYIQYLWEQPVNFTIPSAYQGFNSSNIRQFNLTGFVQAARLNNPVAANYFFCSNQTNVPTTFVAAPGGEYPGGNGAAITSGPGPSITPTSTAGASSTSGASSSGSGSSPSASASGSMAPASKNGLNSLLGIIFALMAAW
ncbi:hypothetical protein H2198_006154 [Neophaeococcomyces mojaviensis]|uniref:Uncharacterized protein n=1 Tax=Neophaeococcomyces mojaviensis TaxID=3383035 RepID=A0ACC3A3V8_9EURO|nr:hypothetical protein H2198_006154 [Knufia sp. JES_112]